MAKLGIYCIENWSGRRTNRDSVKPVLDYLEAAGEARYIHERVSTLDELEHRLDDWAPRKQYTVCYLALHGSPQHVWVGSHELSLQDLLLVDQGDDERPVDLTGKTLFLASCSTLATDASWLQNVRRQTRLNTLCGYGREVEWFEGGAFDLIALSALANYKRSSDAIKYLRREHAGFVDWIDFRSEPAWGPKAPASQAVRSGRGLPKPGERRRPGTAER